MTARLADPRKMTDAVAQTLVKQAKPFYWATGGMHSSETGSVEMLMELAYRLTVDDSPFIRTIRDNAIVLITPILEVDGRDKYVDVAMAPRKDPKDDHHHPPAVLGQVRRRTTTTATTSAWPWPCPNTS